MIRLYIFVSISLVVTRLVSKKQQSLVSYHLTVIVDSYQLSFEEIPPTLSSVVFQCHPNTDLKPPARFRALLGSRRAKVEADPTTDIKSVVSLQMTTDNCQMITDQ